MENFQVYRDIQARTGGDIYIGVVGPVPQPLCRYPRPSAPGYHGKPESFPYKKASLHILACKFRETS